MRFFFRLLPLMVFVASAVAQQYSLWPDSQRQPGVPQGRLEHFEMSSEIFPGTTRDVWVYVPAQYDAAEPAAVMVFQDGHNFIETEGDNAWMTPSCSTTSSTKALCP